MELAQPSTAEGRAVRVKRCFDVVATLFLVPFLLPVVALVAATSAVVLGRPVLFGQERPGKDGVPFTLYKFRTMTDERDTSGRLLPDAERITRYGAVLRTTSLDELPELWNVLRGDMSLVGPRPLLTRYTPYFTQEERRRLLVRPGITGWAQVRGRNNAVWSARLADDVWYVDNRSLWLDLRILLTTVVRVLTRHGLVVDPGAQMLDLDDERKAMLGAEQTVA